MEWRKEFESFFFFTIQKNIEKGLARIQNKTKQKNGLGEEERG